MTLKILSIFSWYISIPLCSSDSSYQHTVGFMHVVLYQLMYLESLVPRTMFETS
jgi:hypothetical protein